MYDISRKRIIINAIATTLTFVSVNMAPVAAESTTSGQCSPVFTSVSGNINLSLSCNSTGANITYQFSAESVGFLGKYFSLDHSAVANLLQRVNNDKIPPYKLVERIAQLVEEAQYLKEQVKSYSTVVEAQELASQIQNSLSAMDLDTAKSQFRMLIAKFEAISGGQKSMENVANVAKSKRDLAKLLMSSHDYDDAFQNFKSALDWTPGRFERQILELRVDLAEAGILGSKSVTDVDRLVDEAVFYTRNLKDTNSSLYLRALQIQIMHSNYKGNFKKSILIFNSELTPFLAQLNRPGVIDLDNLVLCLSCTALAAYRLFDYIQADRIASVGVTAYRNSTRPFSEELVPLLTNRALARSALGRKKDALQDLTSALQILDLRVPDGLHPSVPFVWVNLASIEEDGETKKDYFKKAIVSLAQNMPIYDAVANEILSKITGSGEGLMCYHNARKKDELGKVTFVEAPLYAFNPEDCSSYTFVGLGTMRWSLKDFDDIDVQMRNSIRKYARDEDEVLISVKAGMCTEFIMGGWQEFGRRLCAEALNGAIKSNVRSAQIAESAFRSAQFSDLLGYDFGIDSETLYRFAIDSFIATRGKMNEYTIDAVVAAASYLFERGKASEAKSLVNGFLTSNLEAGEDDATKSSQEKLLDLLASPPKPSKLKPKRKVYASPL